MAIRRLHGSVFTLVKKVADLLTGLAMKSEDDLARNNGAAASTGSDDQPDSDQQRSATVVRFDLCRKLFAVDAAASNLPGGDGLSGSGVHAEHLPEAGLLDTAAERAGLPAVPRQHSAAECQRAWSACSA